MKRRRSHPVYQRAWANMKPVLNGYKVGNGFLTPGWTNYDRTVFYNTYDVTRVARKKEKM